MYSIKKLFEEKIKKYYYDGLITFVYVVEDDIDNSFHLIFDMKPEDVYEIVIDATPKELSEENISVKNFENFLIRMSSKYELELIFPTVVYRNGHIDLIR